MLQAAIAPIQEKIAALEGKRGKDVIDISDDEELSEDNISNKNQLSNVEFPSLKRP
jgi:hypothetical protein